MKEKEEGPIGKEFVVTDVGHPRSGATVKVTGAEVDGLTPVRESNGNTYLLRKDQKKLLGAQELQKTGDSRSQEKVTKETKHV